MTTTAPEFTSHNIALGYAQTRPGTPLLSNTGTCHAALRTLKAAFPGWAPEAIHVADLGCLEGGYAVAFARAGYQAQGIEARDDNFACCRWVQEQLGYPPNLAFVKADVREYVPGHVWDAVFCSGLLYHLDDPGRFITRLGQATRRLLILNTHYAASAEDVHEGNEGRWADENDGRWSSAGNGKSFWITRAHLIRALRLAGFAAVFEQVDYFNDGAGGYIDHHGREYRDRAVFVALKD